MQRVCVSVCPTSGASQLICRPNSVVNTCTVTPIYPSQVSHFRLGGVCTPTNTSAEQVLIQTTNLQVKQNFVFIFDSVKISLLVGLGLGVLWVLFVQCLPRGVAGVVTILAILALGMLGIMALAGKIAGTLPVVTLLVGFILIGVAIMFACFLCFYRMRNKLVPIFLEWSSKFFKEGCLYFVIAFIFVGLTFGLIALCLFQHLAYISHSTPIQVQGDIYLQLVPNYLLFVLNLI